MKFPTFLYHHPGFPRHPPVPPPATRGSHYGGPRPRAEGDLVTSPSTARSGTRDSASQRLAPPPPPPWPPIASSPASASATCGTDCQHKVWPLDWSLEPGQTICGHSGEVRPLELATNLREVFTITEKAPIRALTWLKVPTSTSKILC